MLLRAEQWGLLMSAVGVLRVMLRKAERALTRAVKDYDNLPAERIDRRTEVSRCRARVRELERLLRKRR
jgi:hypothetical protein